MKTGNNAPPLQAMPHRIAHYRIIRKLGQGGMSIVYEGMDERLNRPVAIKILHPFLAESQEYRSRFFREAQAVARLAHPNIVQIFDVALENANNDQLYIVTERLTGDMLNDFIKKHDLFEIPELSAMIIWEVAHALEHAHQKGIIHRDIKPENIMICSNGHIKLMDFGIASIGSDESLTQSGTLLGSLAHLSPEVIKGEKATISSDIFSLTTVLFWAFTNRLPFSSESPHALLKAIVDNPHQKIQSISPFVIDDLADVIEVGLNKDPKARYKSALAMAEALEKALSLMGIAIDTKKLETVLKNPSQICQFKASIIDQITKRIDFYRQTKNDMGVLTLTYRIDAGSSLLATSSSKKRFGWKRGAWLGLALIVAFALLTPLFLPSKKIDVLAPLVLEQELPLSIKVEQLENQNIVSIPSDEISPPPAQDVRFQELEITIWPFADIILDGKMIAKNKKNLKIKLAKGEHKLSFIHAYAATVEKNIMVDEITNPIELNISLIKSKPAFLSIKSNVDGDVAVGGLFKGSTLKSLDQPIVIPMPDKTHSQTKEIIVSKDGYVPIILQTELIAGQTKEIEVKLISLQNDS